MPLTVLEAKREEGAIIVDGQQIASTVQCCHCNKHFVMRKGSGVVRGFCIKCRHVTCGGSGCMPCIPFEAKMEYVESLANGNTRESTRLAMKYPDIILVTNL